MLEKSLKYSIKILMIKPIGDIVWTKPLYNLNVWTKGLFIPIIILSENIQL